MLALKRRKKVSESKLPNRVFIKTGDTVMVVAGKDAGQTGLVRHVFRDRGKVVVEGLNMIKKAVKPNPMIGKAGGIVDMEAPLYLGKVMLYCLKCSNVTRLKMATLENGKKTRQCRKCNANFDE